MPKKGVASVADLQTMYKDSVVMYKNKPYQIIDIGRNFIARCFNLLTQRVEEHEINEIEFTAPARRLGLINSPAGVFYAHRVPIRRYKVGLTRDNTSIQSIDIAYGANANAHLRRCQDLTAPELADCIFNKYPSFIDAVEKVADGVIHSIAFDRQFAVDLHGRVFYKKQHVGKLLAEPKTVYDIKFSPDREYLITLLDNNHEKTLSTSR